MSGVRLRKRPVEITGIQWTGGNETELVEFTGRQFEAVAPEDRTQDPDMTAQVFDVLHGTWIGVYTGQWILRGVKGEYYPCADDVLAETYDVVESG